MLSQNKNLVCQYLCDQMATLILPYCPFVTMKMYPISLKNLKRGLNILPNIKPTLKLLPKTFKRLPLWWTFAKFTLVKIFLHFFNPKTKLIVSFPLFPVKYIETLKNNANNTSICSSTVDNKFASNTYI